MNLYVNSDGLVVAVQGTQLRGILKLHSAHQERAGSVAEQDARYRHRSGSNIVDTCHITAEEQWPSHLVLVRNKIWNHDIILENTLRTKYFILFYFVLHVKKKA